MSVINQMLKDLEQRAPEERQAPLPSVVSQKPSTLKIVLISAVVLLSLNALGFYIWNLQERVAKSIEQQENKQHFQVQKPEPQATNQSKEELPQLPIAPPIEQPEKKQPTQVISNKKEVAQALVLSENESDNVAIKEVKVIEETIVPEVAAAPKVTKMSVSRRQLTSKELVAKKLITAEKAINLNEITKAEQLFEEILIIEPEHTQARKKLAALWFGRKSYQQAVNLLSQGIAIDSQNGELRLLKARIHLKQGQHEKAYSTLKPLASLKHEEYQVTLANVAQQIEQYSSAIAAYQVLITMQPYSGRWHLGLAIVYDQNSQFSLAINEYALALTKIDLSASSAKFAKQRMQALGE